MSKDKNFLVIRNDKLGDFMLAWPALSLLKKQYPDVKVSVLIPSYTRPIAEICPWIDDIITDDPHGSSASGALQLARTLRAHEYDVSISLYSEMRTAIAAWLSRIPQRYGPATKLAQLFLNKRLRQKRSLSLKPEYEYNADLVRYYISCCNDKAVELQGPPYLQFEQNETDAIRKNFIDEHSIDADAKLIFIHAGTGGSAINLTLQQYSELARIIAKSYRAHFVVTAGPDELDTANRLSGLLKGVSHSVYHSTEGLVNFSKFISICDLFISGSTGPLHIAGTLDIPTAAFYPARQSATSLRWQTTNDENKRLAFMPDSYTGDNDMQTINIEECAHKITAQLVRLYQ